MITPIFRNIDTVAGRNLTIIAAAVAPIGIVLGFVEISIALTLTNFLSSYGLLESSELSTGIVFFSIDPAVALMLLATIVVLLRYLAQVIPVYVYEAFGARVRRILAVHQLPSVESAVGFSIADLNHILNNLLGPSASFINGVVSLGVSGSVTITILAGMLFISAELTVVTLAVVVLCGLPVLFLRRSFQSYGTKVFEGHKAYIRQILLASKNILFLQLTGTAQDERDNITAINQTALSMHVSYLIRHTANVVWPGFVALFIIVIIVVVNDRFELTETLALVPFVYLLSRLAGAMSQAANLTGQLQYQIPFVRDLVDHIAPLLVSNPNTAGRSYQTVANSGMAPIRHIESLRTTNLAIGRNNVLIEGLSIELLKGDWLLIMGESGRGKTTLLMTLAGVIPPQAGAIHWNGEPISDLNIDQIRQRMAFSGSEPFLTDSTLRENLTYGLQGRFPTDGEIRQALDIACCDFVEQLSGGIDHRLRESGEGISTGQKQRLSIARAILRTPDVLLLDEATANLDEQTEAQIFAGIRVAYPETIIISVSHRPTSRKFATKVLDID